MKGVTLYQLQCFDALVSEGSFQAAAARLHRSHPTVIAALKTLEEQLGVALFDRSGYRVTLTEAGRAFHERSRNLLREVAQLGEFAASLAAGEETELRIVLGDLCPEAEVIRFLRGFFDGCKAQLHLQFEALSGPWERLLEEEADLIFHHIDKSDQRFEHIGLDDVALIPVAAPGFVPDDVRAHATQQKMKDFVQCVIRDSGRRLPSPQYFLIDGAQRCFVNNQTMKRELILQGVAWGHMPHHMVAADLEAGRLVSLAGPQMQGNTVSIAAVRLKDRAHGPLAQALWRHIRERAEALGTS